MASHSMGAADPPPLHLISTWERRGAGRHCRHLRDLEASAGPAEAGGMGSAQLAAYVRPLRCHAPLIVCEFSLKVSDS